MISWIYKRTIITAADVFCLEISGFQTGEILIELVEPYHYEKHYNSYETHFCTNFTNLISPIQQIQSAALFVKSDYTNAIHRLRTVGITNE